MRFLETYSATYQTRVPKDGWRISVCDMTEMVLRSDHGVMHIKKVVTVGGKSIRFFTGWEDSRSAKSSKLYGDADRRAAKWGARMKSHHFDESDAILRELGLDPNSDEKIKNHWQMVTGEAAAKSYDEIIRAAKEAEAKKRRDEEKLVKVEREKTYAEDSMYGMF